MIERIGSYLFTPRRYTAFCLWNLFCIPCRYENIILKSSELRRFAVGYIKSEDLLFRPKENNIAVMFYYNGNYMWCHLQNKEFEYIFKNKENKNGENG